jgi:hypothetical protein
MYDADFDEKVRQLTVELERVFFGAHDAKVGGNEALRQQLMTRLVEIDFETRALLREAAAEFTALGKVDPKAGDEENVARLLKAFSIGAKLVGLWDDAMQRRKLSGRFEIKLYKIGEALDAIGIGRRRALAVFLDDPDPNVRVVAAARLKDLMPRRCVPVLLDIAKKHVLSGAGQYARRFLPDHFL